MRILFVTNMYPPYARGGYEQWCEEVALALAMRGHRLAVLTSRPDKTAYNRYMADKSVEADGTVEVYRLLHTQVEGSLAQTTLRLLREPKRFEEENIDQTRRVIDGFRPEAVIVWGMWNIDRSVPHVIEALMGSQVAYYFCDYWPTLPSAYVQRLQEPARRAQMQHFKSLVSRYFLPRLMQTDAERLRLENPICVSRAVRDILVSHGVDVAHAKIVHGGTSVEEFDAISRSTVPGEMPLRLLYIGRLLRIKGIHTIIKAMQILDVPVVLDILGAGDPDYVAELEAMVVQGEVGGRVRFLGAALRTQVPQVLVQHDVLLFSSEWDEPFARSVLEAMAAGLVVIGTTTGGTGEILVEGETGLTYPAGDAGQLAAQIRRLANDPVLRRRLGESGYATVRQHFTLGRMVDDLEAELIAIASKPVQITS
jgi:glycogen synthase